MNKQDLMAEVRDTTGLSKEQAERAVEAVFGLITEALRRGDEVRIVGFGSFFVGTRAASPGRNPRTGERIDLPPTKQPKFRAGKTLKEAVS
ncbi:HU family DNA-binding protein [Ferrovibrio sp.]|uniref:HU family DNA-binding protein n=1 Tax=Ferrovibrio sp. TaxID=1917215 RepID=UPI00311F708D